jgi:hypothetical protein
VQSANRRLAQAARTANDDDRLQLILSD